MVRAAIVLGAVRTATTVVANVPDQEAADLVWRGDATYTDGAPAQSVEIDDSININTAQIADSGAVGQAVLKSATLDAFLTAIGASLGAANSGGAGYKQLIFPNADT